ncbi:MAG: exosortase-associated EpsI family protein [Anaerolineae bacterium]
MERGKWKGENGKGNGESDPPFSILHLPPSIFRFGLVVSLLLIALGASFTTRRLIPAATPERAGPGSTDTVAGGQVYFVDTEGWYRITDNERAVVSPYLLNLDALPDSLPMDLGSWHGKPLPLEPEVAQWFDDPEVADRREYRNAEGDIVWLSVFGSRGPKSFRLFEHTPATCYPLSGWTMIQEDQDAIAIGNGELLVQRGFAVSGDHELTVLYLYLWDSPNRDPADGVVSIRVAAPIRTDEAETLRLVKQDFLPHLFTDVIPWRRF